MLGSGVMLLAGLGMAVSRKAGSMAQCGRDLQADKRSGSKRAQPLLSVSCMAELVYKGRATEGCILSSQGCTEVLASVECKIE